MSYRRILTVQDISCVGQCSMTVALPVLSACGCETCVLPSAVLSSHTGGFTNPVFRDLSEDIPQITQHWEREKITFDAVYTGYLGSVRQIGYLRACLPYLMRSDSVLIVDPAMADHGKLYKGFDESYMRAMTEFCMEADVILPNITEACMMTGRSVPENYDDSEIRTLMRTLAGQGRGTVILTGVEYRPGETGVAVWHGGEYWYHAHPKVAKSYHGTGDLFSAAFTGSWMRTGDIHRAVTTAAAFTAQSIQNTFADPAHWYGVKFETAIPELIRLLQK